MGGLSFTSADLVEYDIAADSAILYLPGASVFADPDEKITSVHVGPGSGTIEIATGISGTYLDEFNAIAYNGNDGDLDWSNDWQEVAESDGTNSGIAFAWPDAALLRSIHTAGVKIACQPNTTPPIHLRKGLRQTTWINR